MSIARVIFKYKTIHNINHTKDIINASDFTGLKALHKLTQFNGQLIGLKGRVYTVTPPITTIMVNDILENYIIKTIEVVDDNQNIVPAICWFVPDNTSSLLLNGTSFVDEGVFLI